MPCPPVAQLQALLTGSLSPEDAQEVGPHVDRCPSCKATLDELSRQDGLLDDMRALLAPEPTPPTATLPEHIAQYRILDVIGEGGMGVVYRAEQERPHRQVALKVMHPTTVSRRSLRRFELEVEVLGQLDHAGIARIYEAGTAHVFSTDQPFFAMELVDGQRLDRYVEAHDLDREARLLLFLEVCDAVHYAHLRGVIHRDLKPGNILVDGEGRPKVIDFGLARASASGEEAQSLRTERGGMLGTLPYMAPEQVDSDPDTVDTRADVYGLGAVLYELLCGRPPLVLTGDPLPRAARRITEEAPPRPSSLSPDLPRELDWVLGRALAKQPGDRYDAVSAFTADLRRVLAHEPLEAGPPGALYRARLFVRRHRLGVAAAGLAFLALAIGAGFTIHGLVETSRAGRIEAEAHAATRAAEAEARHNAEEMTRVADFVLSMFEQGPGESAGANDAAKPDRPSMHDLLDRITPRIEAELPDLPRHRADLYDSVGMSWYALGDEAQARRFLEQALALRVELFGRLHEESLESIHDLGQLALDQSRMEEAVSLLEEAVAGRQQLLEESDLDLRRSVGLLARARAERAHRLGAVDPRAEALLRRHLELTARTHGAQHPALADSLHALGAHLYTLDRFDESLAILREALTLSRRHLPEDSPDKAVLHRQIGGALRWLRQQDAARCEYEHALTLLDATLGPEHPSTLRTRLDLAMLLEKQGELELCFKELRLARDAARLTPPGEDPQVDDLRPRITSSLRQARDATMMTLSAALEESEAQGDPDSDMAVVLRERLMRRSLEAGVMDMVHIELLWTVFQSRQRRLGTDHPVTLEALAHVANVYSVLGDEGRFAQALELLDRFSGPCLDRAGPDKVFALNDLADVLEGYGLERRAGTFARAAYQLRTDVWPPPWSHTWTAADPARHPPPGPGPGSPETPPPAPPVGRASARPRRAPPARGRRRRD